MLYPTECLAPPLFPIYDMCKIVVVAFFILGSLSARYGVIRMSASYYFEGDCTKSEAILDIQKKFIETLNSSPSFELACTSKEDKCRVENVQVIND
jgi:hypothetical protein